MTWPRPTAWPGSMESSVTTPARCAGYLDGEHRALHRGHDRVLDAALPTGGLTVASSSGELGVRGLGHEGLNLVTPTVELDG